MDAHYSFIWVDIGDYGKFNVIITSKICFKEKSCEKYICVYIIGSLNDVGIWSNTAMKQAFENNTLSVSEARCILNTNCPLPFAIVEDKGFPLKTYIMRKKKFTK